jgi:hypothetical protein
MVKKNITDELEKFRLDTQILLAISTGISLNKMVHFLVKDGMHSGLLDFRPDHTLCDMTLDRKGRNNYMLGEPFVFCLEREDLPEHEGRKECPECIKMLAYLKRYTEE